MSSLNMYTVSKKLFCSTNMQVLYTLLHEQHWRVVSELLHTLITHVVPLTQQF